MVTLYPHGYSCLCPNCMRQDMEILGLDWDDPETGVATEPSLPVEPAAGTGMDGDEEKPAEG